MSNFKISQSDIPGATPSTGSDCYLDPTDPMYSTVYADGSKLRLPALDNIDTSDIAVPVINAKQPKIPLREVKYD